MKPEELLKSLAKKEGFDLAGIAIATDADGFSHLQDWLDSGLHGQMDYMAEYRTAYQHPKSILKEVKSILMVAYNYKTELPTPEKPNMARVARYAQGTDYHLILWNKLNNVLKNFRNEHASVNGRGVVDTTPLLERDFARRAGLGWIGKNTMLIHKKLGSFILLGALLLDMELQPDLPSLTSHCGTCTACLDACPTQAFISPKKLDARKCISYLTIEHKTDIPENLREGIQNWIQGCDICQDVCPWNRKTPDGEDWKNYFNPGQAFLDPLEVLNLSQDEFRIRFKKTAMWRPRMNRIFRNACIVLGNIGNESHLKTLEGLSENREPLVANAALWALTQIQKRISGKEEGQSCSHQL